MPDYRVKTTVDDGGVSSGEKDICVRLGQRIRKLRTKRGWSQTYMAVHLGLDRSYISDLEGGKREICIRNLEVIALGFGVTPAQLLSKI